MTGTTVQIPDGLLIQLNVHTHVLNYTHECVQVCVEEGLGSVRLMKSPRAPRQRLTPEIVFRAGLRWEADRDHPLWLSADYDGERIHVRINPSFPDDPLYSLLVDEDETYDFNDFPQNWERIGDLSWPGIGPWTDQGDQEGAMTVDTVLTTVRGWLAAAEAASMELPDGWFGRPYDNMHRLTWSVQRDGKLFLELDHQLHLVLADPVIGEVSAENLDLRCSQLTFDWREYGSIDRRHVTAYHDGGTVRFHASGL